MKLTFLGTRGEIEARSYRHRRHSALLIERDEARIMIDCWADWLHRLRRIALTAIPTRTLIMRRAQSMAPVPGLREATTLRLLGRPPIPTGARRHLRRTVRTGGVRLRAVPGAETPFMLLRRRVRFMR